MFPSVQASCIRMLFGALLLSITSAPGLLAQETAVKPVAAQPAASASPQIKSAPPEPSFPMAGKDSCSEGVVFDDGSVEGGLGYFNNVQLGELVQRFDSPKLSGKSVAKVCVGLFSNAAEEMAFEVVFYREEGGLPAAEPYAAVAAETGSTLPKKMAEAGRFYSVDISDVTMPEGASYVGVRWNPMAAERAFVALDKSDGEGRTPVATFHRDSVSTGWEDLPDPSAPPPRSRDLWGYPLHFF